MNELTVRPADRSTKRISKHIADIEMKKNGQRRSQEKEEEQVVETEVAGYDERVCWLIHLQ